MASFFLLQSVFHIPFLTSQTELGPSETQAGRGLHYGLHCSIRSWMDGTDLEAALVIKWLTHVFPITTAGHLGRVGLMAAILQWLMAQSIDLFVSVPLATAANFQLPSPSVTVEDSSFTNSNELLVVSRSPLHVTVATDCQVLHQVKLRSVITTCVLK